MSELDLTELSTITDWLRYGISQAYAHPLYYGHGTDNAYEDIKALVLGSLHLPWDTDTLLWQARLTSPEKLLLAQQLQKRILERVPVPYLTNEAYFSGLSFYVDERVLIPRSPIAELIENRFSPWLENSLAPRILDMCTGSACIAIACCYAFPEAQVEGVDISFDALEVAEINLKKHDLADSLTLIQSDLFAQIVPSEQYDLIICNPPYVGADEMKTLPKEYHYEPVLALEAREHGLAIVHEVLRQASQYLTPKGFLLLEVGNSADALIEAYPQLPFTWLDFVRGGDGVFLLTKIDLQAYQELL
jgi:ribosomal protein L3 glutamine methyltransferase